jgi:hypothetical protein
MWHRTGAVHNAGYELPTRSLLGDPMNSDRAVSVGRQTLARPLRGVSGAVCERKALGGEGATDLIQGLGPHTVQL